MKPNDAYDERFEDDYDDDGEEEEAAVICRAKE